MKNSYDDSSEDTNDIKQENSHEYEDNFDETSILSIINDTTSTPLEKSTFKSASTTKSSVIQTTTRLPVIAATTAKYLPNTTKKIKIIEGSGSAHGRKLKK